MDEHSENFKKELENIKKNQTELKNKITEIKNTLDVINSRLDDTEESTGGLKDSVVDITQAEQKKEKITLENENSLRGLWDNIKCTNICIIEVSEGEEREVGREFI